ncbi:unnamed protein product [Dicrocoelium dendriticum]|nr:unnamed protein product [Dicrocoelium dendriticum]
MADTILQQNFPGPTNDSMIKHDKSLASPTSSESTLRDSGTAISAVPASTVVSTVDSENWRMGLPSSPRSERPLGARSTVRGTSQDWSKLIARSEKKFVCLLCRRYIYSGRTEVVFHSVTRHLLSSEIEHNLSHYGRLTDSVKRRIGHNFAEGMRIRSGVHYKDAKRVEAALFRSIELHLRYTPTDVARESGSEGTPRFFSCSGCGATFSEIQVHHVYFI